MNPNFIGENLVPGIIGHILIITSFTAALFSCFAFFRSAATERLLSNESRTWLKIARTSFVIHFVAVIGIFGVLYYIITHHLFEYHYAWAHSDKSLPMKYLLSCFWEGQEGSFLLWTFWHCVLGCVVMGTAKSLESRTMTIVALVQAALATMVLGFHFGPDVNIGTSPFALLRNEISAPIFSQPNYLSLIKDGNGLNVLLQNYWMTIHPPILFLGFASVLFPFAFAMAGLWKGDYQIWVRPALKWSLFSGGALALGIMMGGAWAYESLNFGGYWAWDPVENASLVPWMLLVAGLHTLVIYKATGRSFIVTMIFLSLAYALVWYSTFLTRTGVLGETSVHAFTGEGSSLFWHLLIVLGVLLGIATSLLIWRWKSLPRVRTEEAVSSREFWMFIGSFILLLSATHIIIMTSLPVWAPLAKLITGKEIAPPTEVVESYNSVQVWVAVIMGLLTGSILYLKFKKSDSRKSMMKIGGVAVGALLLSGAIAYAQSLTSLPMLLMLFSASFTIVGMLYYAFGVQTGSWMKRGAALSHFGFGVLLLGILISGYNKQVISYNTTGAVLDFGKKTASENRKESQENSIMYRGVPVAMGDYFATFLGDSTSTSDTRTFYNVRYERKDSATGKVLEHFMLHPDAFVNPKGQEGLSANPDSKHYLTHDIFTYISNTINKSKLLDTMEYTPHLLKKGEKVTIIGGYAIMDSFGTFMPDRPYTPEAGDIPVTAHIRAFEQDGTYLGELNPIFNIRGNGVVQVDDTLSAAGLYARFSNILPDENAVEIGLKQLHPTDDYIVMKALLFPYINLVWLGTILLVLGFWLTMLNRVRKDKGV